MAQPLSPAPSTGGIVSRVATAAAVVALLDFSYVFVLWVVVRQKLTTAQLLQSIASGLLGRAAYQGGWAAALLGGALHLTIALIWTLLYVGAIRHLAPIGRLAAERGGRVVLGLGYGIVIWWSMDLIVLPLSQARPVPFLSWTFAINSLQHACMVGLPIAVLIGTGRPRGPG